MLKDHEALIRNARSLQRPRSARPQLQIPRRKQFDQIMRLVAINHEVRLWTMVICEGSGQDDRLVRADPFDLVQQVSFLFQQPGMHHDDINIRKSAEQIETIGEIVRSNYVVLRGLHNQLARGKTFRLFFFHHQNYERSHNLLQGTAITI